MYEIEYRTKRPATVIDTRPVETMTAPYHAKADLVAAVTRGARRGEIRPLTARPRYNDRTGRWEQQVTRLRPENPAWVRPVMILGTALLVVALLAGLLWWVLSTLTAASLGLFLIVALVVLAGIARAGKQQTVNIVVNQR